MTVTTLIGTAPDVTLNVRERASERRSPQRASTREGERTVPGECPERSTALGAPVPDLTSPGVGSAPRPSPRALIRSAGHARGARCLDDHAFAGLISSGLISDLHRSSLLHGSGMGAEPWTVRDGARLQCPTGAQLTRRAHRRSLTSAALAEVERLTEQRSAEPIAGPITPADQVPEQADHGPPGPRSWPRQEGTPCR